MVVTHQQSRSRVFGQYAAIVFTLALAAGLSGNAAVLPAVSDHTLDNLANVVGIAAGVPENDVNRLMAELGAQETELSAREQELAAREAALSETLAQEVRRENMRAILALVAAIIILFLLLCFNFYEDHIRARKLREIPEQKNDHRGELQTRL